MMGLNFKEIINDIRKENEVTIRIIIIIYAIIIIVNVVTIGWEPLSFPENISNITNKTFIP